jgi:ergothioneine biosynthesis protein EgtB
MSFALLGYTADMNATSLSRRFKAVRARTLALVAPLTVEDQLVQPMADASPSKWHLAHTTWFFETIVLAAPDPDFNFLFNSYYESIGPRVERARRGMLSRPSLERVMAYRDDVDQRVLAALANLDHALVELGLHHEQQHQELILTDAKYMLGTQPTRPRYAELSRPTVSIEQGWRVFDSGVIEIGAPPTGFAFDNERPRHRVFVEPFRIATRALANRDVQEFIAAGGYRNSQWWLSDGWAFINAEHISQPLYWNGDEVYTLGGVRAIDPDETACHLSYYEADAIARFRGARLPTEAEWELAASSLDPNGNFADDDRFHPGAGTMFGDVWEWTQSAYLPYPGFRELGGAVGEYNGKFMSGQQVLRGGSCFTPRDHIRASYRNFFPPSARWQMSGVRLAEDGGRR